MKLVKLGSYSTESLTCPNLAESMVTSTLKTRFLRLHKVKELPCVSDGVWYPVWSISTTLSGLSQHTRGRPNP
jgi:hypothetical protein